MTRRFEHDRAAVRRTEVNIDARSTALVILDPRNRFRGAQAPSGRLEDGLTALVRAARESGVPVFLSPHYYYPVDHGWEFQDSLRRRMDSIGMFRNRGATLVQRAARSGATRRRQGRYWPGAVAGLGAHVDYLRGVWDVHVDAHRLHATSLDQHRGAVERRAVARMHRAVDQRERREQADHGALRMPSSKSERGSVGVARS